MKIVLMGTAYPYRGGLAAFNERLAREFSKRGDDVVIYNFSLQYPSIFFPGKSQYSDEPAPEGLNICRRVNSVNPANWLRVGRELRRMAPDILLVKYWLPLMAPAFGTICREVRRNGKTKVVCIADNVIPHEHRVGDMALSRYFAKSVDAWIGMSKEVYDDVLKVATNPIRRLVPHPIYDNYGEPIAREKALELLGLDKSCRYLLFFGFIREYKGLDLLLRSLAEPELRGREDLKLIVAGEFYCDSAPYLKLIEELGIGERVILHTDYIPNDYVSRYFSAADLIVQPYKSATQSGVTQIGYHFGCPMLVTNVGGLHEIIADRVSGYVVEPTVHDIAVAIADFYDNGREAAFREATVERKKMFGWDKLADAITGAISAEQL